MVQKQRVESIYGVYLLVHLLVLVLLARHLVFFFFQLIQGNVLRLFSYLNLDFCFSHSDTFVLFGQALHRGS